MDNGKVDIKLHKKKNRKPEDFLNCRKTRKKFMLSKMNLEYSKV